ncbi:MAG: phosphotriesterase [Lachnospiraceae bacterium]|nr:phosphotriesterase [Lachnospiraceae bacterium]
MAVIRTILGDIAPEQFGACDFHEHLIRSSGPELAINPWYDMSDVDAAGEELQDFIDAGGKSMLLMDPIGCGRDVPRMLEIAKRFEGKAHLVMVTGFHKGGLYDNRGHWSVICPQRQVVDMLVKEVTEGMDIYSYAGPIVERSSARAGAIKAGTSNQMITPFEQNALAIAAQVQKECGVCISTHTDMGTMGPETLKVLKDNGADMEKTVLCHTNKMKDTNYFLRMLDTGANLCFEGADRPMWATDTECAMNMLYLVERGYQKQILLSMDAGRNVWQKGYMKKEGKIVNGISYMLTDFVPLLRKVGVPEDALQDILVNNPARVLAIG